MAEQMFEIEGMEKKNARTRREKTALKNGYGEDPSRTSEESSLSTGD